MKRFEPTLFLLLSLFLSVTTNGQNITNLQTRTQLADSMVISLDTLTLVPSSFTLEGLDSNQYRVDYLNATIYITDSSVVGKQFTCQYRTFPFNLEKKHRHKSTSLITPKWKPIAQQIIPISTTSNTPFDNEADISYNGSISRGVTIGNNQDMALNSTLNLQLSGWLAKDLRIEANITDQNIPIQPEGNTRVVQDFDQIFIRLNYQNRYLVNAGDIDITSPTSRYISLNKRILGLEFVANDTLNKNNSIYSRTGAGMAKGKFSRNELSIIDGVQGPYRLTGEHNETTIVILAGSERVYIDGQLTTRGQENDYVIDYNTGEITFTSRQLITREKRIVVEFEYSDQYYSRITAYTFNEFRHEKSSKLKLNVNFIHEQDLKNRSIQPELDNYQKLFLSGIGDQTATAYPNIDSLAFSSSEIRYEKKDTIVEGKQYTIYQYSTDPTKAYYRIGFSYVGENAGNYVLLQSSANGKVYGWRAPVNGVRQGNYEPTTQLATPKLTEMGSIAAQYDINDRSGFRTEFAFSNHDQNLFSKQDDKDNIGFSYNIEAFHSTQLKQRKQQKNAWSFNSLLNYEIKHKNFHTIERYRDVEFNRDYNLTNNDPQTTEHLLEASAGFSNPDVGETSYKLHYFSQHNLRNIIKNDLYSLTKHKGFKFQTNTSYLYSKDTLRYSHFARSANQLSQTFKKIEIGLLDNMEYNIYKDTQTKLLQPNSYSFNEVEAYLKNNDSLPYHYRIYFKNRIDAQATDNQLYIYSKIYEASASFELTKLKNNHLRGNATFRSTHLKDSAGHVKADNNLVGSLEYTGRFFKNAIVINTYYEMGQGLEAKKNFSFIKVAAGQGTHTWNDYNNNGIEELNEFEIAAFQDEAEYIKVWLPSNEFMTVFNHQFSQTIQLRPAAVWYNKKGFKKFLSRFSDAALFRTTQKNDISHSRIGMIPFRLGLNDTAQTCQNTQFKNTFSFNQNSSVFGIDFITQISQSKSLLYYGFDIAKNKLYEVIIRGNPKQNITLKTDYSYNSKNIHSEYLKEKSYHINSHLSHNSMQIQLNNRFFWNVIYAYKHKQNTTGKEKSSQHQAEIDFIYRIANKGTLNCNIKYINIVYKGESNSSIGYEMLEGLQTGNNMVWSAAYQMQITNFLELNFLYEGRASQGYKMIHTGSVQVRAHF